MNHGASDDIQVCRDDFLGDGTSQGMIIDQFGQSVGISGLDRQRNSIEID
jgi:hypothetical protein